MEYRFVEKKIEKDDIFIFLCGSRYRKQDARDKRNVLSKYLKEKSCHYVPIILEENFNFKRSTGEYLSYLDIDINDLQKVEMLTTYLADKVVILQESISTSAEVGLFLSEKSALKKTCLLVPDKYSVEENKIGTFMNLAFVQRSDHVRIIKFYPSVEKKHISNDVEYWHTFFYDNKIGTNLGLRINKFIEEAWIDKKIEFSSKLEDMENGSIAYRHIKDRDEWIVTILPRTLLICIVSMLNINAIQQTFFSPNARPFRETISFVKEHLVQIFINTLQEKTGKKINKLTIRPRINVSDIYISEVIGMCLYMLKAVGYIGIKKAADYKESRKVQMKRKTIITDSGNRIVSYEKYKDLVEPVVERQIL